MNKINCIWFLVFVFLISCEKSDYNAMQRNSFVKFFGSQYFNSANDVLQDNGNYVFVGYTVQEFPNRLGLIVKTNEFGNAVFEGVSTLNGNVELNGICIGNDYSYVVCGKIEDSLGQSDVYIAKFSIDGALIWENTFGGDNDQFGNKIVTAHDGGYVVVGGSTNASGNNNPEGVLDLMLAKIDEFGDSVKMEQYGGSQPDIGNDIIKYNSSNYFVVGTAESFTGGADNGFSPNHAGELVYILKLGLNLGPDDAFCIGDGNNQTGNTIKLDANGNLLIGGGYSTGGPKQGYVMNVDANNIRAPRLDSVGLTGEQLEIFDLDLQIDGTICATGSVTINSVDKISVNKINSTSFEVESSFDLGYTGFGIGNRVITADQGGFVIAGSSLFELNEKAVLIKLNEKVEL